MHIIVTISVLIHIINKINIFLIVNQILITNKTIFISVLFKQLEENK